MEEESCRAEMVNVRYLVDDVEAAVAWYTTHLGFTLLSKQVLRSRMSRAAPCASCSAARQARLADQCPPVSGPSQAAGTAFISSLTIFLPKLRDCAQRA